MCSHTFTLFWSRKTSVIVEIFQLSFHEEISSFFRWEFPLFSSPYCCVIHTSVLSFSRGLKFIEHIHTAIYSTFILNKCIFYPNSSLPSNYWFKYNPIINLSSLYNNQTKGYALDQEIHYPANFVSARVLNWGQAVQRGEAAWDHAYKDDLPETKSP